MQNNLSSSQETLNSQQPRQFKVLLIGDLCKDIYHHGAVERISPEAPVPVLKITETVEKAGMAGNVNTNLTTLGVDVDFAHGESCTRTRIIDQKSKQHIVRLDKDVISDPINIDVVISSYDAVVISDYEKGMVSYDTVKQIRSMFDGPIFVDTKKTLLHILDGDNVFVKINNKEFDKLQTSCTNLIVTYGSTGVMYQANFFEAKKVEVSDITGAGDTFLAALVYQYLYTRDMQEAIKFAIRASAVAVQHVGVYAPTLEEIGLIA